MWFAIAEGGTCGGRTCGSSPISTVPVEFFSPASRTAAFATPHGWASDGFAALTRRGGDLFTIAPHLGVLLGFATLLFSLGAWALRRAVTR